MKNLLIPLLLGLLGGVAGVAAALFLPGAPENHAEVPGSHKADGHATETYAEHGAVKVAETYVKMPNQFIVPIVHDGAVRGLAVLSLSIGLTKDGEKYFKQKEPKLQGELLQVLFDFANAGAFDGAYTSGAKMQVLQQALLKKAKYVAGKEVSDLIINEILRQDSS